MAWAEWQWMSVELPLEEQLMVERQVRAVHDHVNTKEIAELCSSLIRQNHHQQKLLQQAIKRIMELKSLKTAKTINRNNYPGGEISFCVLSRNLRNARSLI